MTEPPILTAMHDEPLVVPSRSTPPAAVRPPPEILSRAEIARRRMASEAKPQPVVEEKKKPGWPKGKPRK